MKKIFLLSFLLYCIQTISAQQAMNMRLLSHWNDKSLVPIDGDQLWSDIGGYYDSIKQKEYAVMLGNDSLYFFDMTNPTQLKLVAKLDGYSTKSINRDVEFYSHYAYFSAQRSGSLGGLQIVDLQYLPDSIHEIYRSDSLTVQAHTIYIEAKSKRLYICENSTKMGFSAMDILSLENAERPVKLASLQVPINGQGQQLFSKVHEMYCSNDTAYLSCYEAGLFIIDLRDVNNQQLIGTIANYPQRGTNHSSWLNGSGKTIMFTDENLGSPIKLFDITDISNPKQMAYFNSHTNALPHNAYWKDNMAVVSSYEDGVYVYDLRDENNPKIHAYYDTYLLNPEGSFSGFHGCWGVWPFLPSGNIIASDISEGLFVLKINYGVGVVNNEIKTAEKITLYPNPAKNNITINLPENSSTYHVQISNSIGQTIKQVDVNDSNKQIDVSSLPSGVYLVNIHTENTNQQIKFVRE
ncbi:MAG: choice-of-anchor B family protein [Bacteroidota bacterium]